MNRFLGYRPVPLWWFALAFLASVGLFNALMLAGLLPRSYVWWDSIMPGLLGVWALYTIRSRRKGFLMGTAMVVFFLMIAVMILLYPYLWGRLNEFFNG